MCMTNEVTVFVISAAFSMTLMQLSICKKRIPQYTLSYKSGLHKCMPQNTRDLMSNNECS